MRALVLKQAGQDPVVSEFDEPPAGEGLAVEVVAAAINPYDRFMAQMATAKTPHVVGSEAVARLPDGRLAYVEAVSPYGTVSEKTLAKADRIIELPEGIEPGQAVAMGVSGLAAWLPLSWKAQLKPGESVLILGATGVQGQIAVQAAKIMGAGHVVAAGRNRAVLEALKQRGADDIVVLEGDLAANIKNGAPDKGFDVVVDSLFGEPFAGLMQSGALGAASRVVVLGGSAGQAATLSFRDLQSAKGATIAGYSTFFVPPKIKKQAYLSLTEHVISGDIEIEIQTFPLEEAAKAWAAQATGPHSKIVVTP